MKESRVCLLRHAPPDIRPGVCYGQLDLPLLATAFDDIKQLRERWLIAPQRVFASDLQRARLTAERLLIDYPVPVITDARLRELSMGEWEGREWDSIYRDDRARFDAWGADWVKGSPPGGESALDLFARVGSFAREHLAPSSSVHPTLIVAHAGSLRALACVRHRQTPSALFEYDFDGLTPVSLWSQARQNHAEALFDRNPQVT